MRMLCGIAGLCAVLALGGCGTGDAEPSSGQASDSASSADEAEEGTSAPEELEDFVCEPDGSDEWSADGEVRNGGKEAADYRVSVFVGVADGKEASAETVVITDVAAGKAEPFELADLPVDGDEPQCFARVLRVPS